MERTKKRALVTGQISGTNALIYATILGSAGTLTLLWLTNTLTAALALFGLFAYVVLYGIAKRKSPIGTIVGSVSGAIPPVVGYVASTNQLDSIAVVLFLVLTAWQMPHFYAIAMYRSKDYKAAGIPVLPLVSGARITQLHIIGYIVLYGLALVGLFIVSELSVAFLAIALLSALFWLYSSLKGFRALDSNAWARKMFGISLLVLLSFCAGTLINLL